MVIDLVAETATISTLADLSEVLRQLRRRQARAGGHPPLTYRQLARHAGWSHGIIGEYLSGRVLPPTDRLDLLTSLLGATGVERSALAVARDRLEDRRRESASPEPRVDVPVPPACIVDRQPARTLLDRALADHLDRAAVSVVLVWGDPGIGKTTLAMTWAHTAVRHFPDGLLYASAAASHARGTATAAASVARQLIDGLGPPTGAPPAPPDQLAGRCRSMLAGRRALIVVDDVQGPEDIRPLLPGTPGHLILVLSRRALISLVAVENARPLHVGAMTAAESRTLLLGRLGATPAAADIGAIEHIVAASRGVPRALARAADCALRPSGDALQTVAADVSRYGVASPAHLDAMPSTMHRTGAAHQPRRWSS